MTTSHEHLPVLRCPNTKASLREADPGEIETLNERVRDGLARTVAGAQVEREIGDMIVSEDGQYAYPIENGVYVLLTDLAIVLESDGSAEMTAPSLNDAKESVRGFYEGVGWQRAESGFMDAALFEDLRPVSEEYRHNCNLRVTKHLPHDGRYILDAASGPIQYQDYLDFSNGYDVRVCVDFSVTALREVKEKLAGRALCLLADVTRLPLKDNSMDAAISLHTIYHVPQAEQATAFVELHRVVTASGTVVVVYTWSRSLIVRLVHVPMRLLNVWGRGVQAVRRVFRLPTDIGMEPIFKDLYFHPQSRQWFFNQQWPFDYKVYTWRSVGVGALQFYFSSSSRGKRRLARLERLENRFPELCGRWGLYPLIVISGARKKGTPSS